MDKIPRLAPNGFTLLETLAAIVVISLVLNTLFSSLIRDSRIVLNSDLQIQSALNALSLTSYDTIFPEPIPPSDIADRIGLSPQFSYEIQSDHSLTIRHISGLQFHYSSFQRGTR